MSAPRSDIKVGSDKSLREFFLKYFDFCSDFALDCVYGIFIFILGIFFQLSSVARHSHFQALDFMNSFNFFDFFKFFYIL